MLGIGDWIICGICVVCWYYWVVIGKVDVVLQDLVGDLVKLGEIDMFVKCLWWYVEEVML